MRYAAGVMLGVLLSALLAAPATAATSKVPTAVTTLTAPKAMAAANGRLFVSEGNTVVVLGTDGRTTRTISGLFGAAGIVANGDRVYVALSQAAAIAVLDPATLTEVGRWTTAACPVTLAFAGTRLFYGHGCPTNGTPGLGSVDATTGAGAQAVPGSFSSAPLVAGAGSTLAVGVPGLSPATVSTYRVDGTTVTPLATAEVGSYVGGVSVSKDGTKVATAAGSPYHLSQFTAKTMAAAGTFDTGAYPATVAYSPDGARLGGGIDAHGAGNVRAFHVATGLSLLDGNAHPKAAYNQPSPVTGTLTWAADGSRLYTLLDESDNGKHRYWLASGFGTVPDPVKTTTTLKITAPATYGAKVRAVATVAGRAEVPVRFVRTGPAGTATVTATTTASGVATALIAAPAGGKVTAYFDGDDTYAASSASASFKTLTRTAIAVTGQYKTVGKVHYFKDKSQVVAVVRVTAPVAGRSITLRLQRKSGSKWQTVHTLKWKMPADATDYFTLVQAANGVQYRFAAAFAGDAYGKGSAGTSAAVIIK